MKLSHAVQSHPRQTGHSEKFSQNVVRCTQFKKQQLETDMEKQTGSKLGKEYGKVVYYLPVYFNFYAECIMWNAGLNASQAIIKFAGRNTTNLTYADDTTL